MPMTASDLWTPDEAWAPLLYTPPKNLVSVGDPILDFSEQFLVALRGFREGEPLVMTAWQQWLMQGLFETDENGYFRYRQALIGLPRKNGKSLLGMSIALYYLLIGGPGTEIYSAARDRDQAKIVFGLAKAQVLRSPMLSSILDAQQHKIVNKVTGAIYRALSADALSAQGLGPEIVIADEIHVWDTNKGRDLWDALTQGSGDRPESMVIAITTAAGSKDTLLGELYTMGEKIIRGEVDNPSFGMFWWGAPDDADITDPEVWRKANPNLAEGLMSYEQMENEVTAAENMDLNRFKRYRLNQWVHVGVTPYLSPKQVEDAMTFPMGSRIPKGNEITVGFDGSVSDDTTGFVAIDYTTGLVETLYAWEKPQGASDWVVPRDEVLAAKEQIFKDYKVLRMWCDPSFFQSDVDLWAAKGLYRQVQRIPQSNTRMIPITNEFKVDLTSGKIGHSGDKQLVPHLLNAVETDIGKIRKDRPKSPRKIDLAVCAILANGARNSLATERQTVQRVKMS